MDPTQCLTKIKSLSSDIIKQLGSRASTLDEQDEYVASLIDYIEGLDEWMSKGGFPPDQWDHARGRPYRKKDGEVVELAKHGTRGGYNASCRCMLCTMSNRMRRNLTTDEMEAYHHGKNH